MKVDNAEDGNGSDVEGSTARVKVISLTTESKWVVLLDESRVHIVSREHTRRFYDAVCEWAKEGFSGSCATCAGC